MSKLLERIVDMPGGFLFVSGIIMLMAGIVLSLFANGLLFLGNTIGIGKSVQSPLAILLMLSGIAMTIRRVSASDARGGYRGGYHEATTDEKPKNADESRGMLGYSDLFYTEYDPPQVAYNPSNERYWE